MRQPCRADRPHASTSTSSPPSRALEHVETEAARRFGTTMGLMGLAALLLGLGCDAALTEPNEGTDGSAAVALTVEPAQAEGVTGDTVHFDATLMDDAGNPVTSGYTLSWASSDPAVATVDAQGVATVQDSGSATITATASASDTTLSDDATLQGMDDDGSGSGSATVSNVSPSAYELDTLEAGTDYYVDRSFTVESVPDAFRGWTLIKTANDDKADSADTFLTFELSDSATVAVAYDPRATTLPAWLEGWTSAGDSLTTTDLQASPVPIYTRTFGSGAVELGGNLSDGAQGANSMYVPFVGAGAGTDGDGSTNTDSVAAVTVSPSSATLSSIGATRQFNAEATDADGGNVAGVSFTWSSSEPAVATVEADGTATAQGEGFTHIIATARGVTDSATLSVDTTDSGSGGIQLGVGGGANEPAGYSKILEWDMGHELPPDGSLSDAQCASWPGGSIDGAGRMLYSRDPGNTSNFSLVEDPTAPVSGPRVQKVTWFAGHELKLGLPPDIYLWSGNVDPCAAKLLPSEQFREVYVSLWFKVWSVEDVAEGNGKLGHILPQHTILTETQELSPTDFGVKNRVIYTDASGTVQTQVYFQNNRDLRPIHLGHWHHLEVQYIGNSVAGDGSGNPDGIIRYWIDGTLVLEHTDVIMGSANDPPLMHRWYDGHTYGTRQNKTALDTDEGFMFDHLYISGQK